MGPNEGSVAMDSGTASCRSFLEAEGKVGGGGGVKQITTKEIWTWDTGTNYSNYIETKTKCRLLKILTCKGTSRQVFSRLYIDRRYSQSSHVGIFDPAVWAVAPLTFSLVHLSPIPLFPVWTSILYTRIRCVKGGVWGSGPQADKHLPKSPFTGQFF